MVIVLNIIDLGTIETGYFDYWLIESLVVEIFDFITGMFNLVKLFSVVIKTVDLGRNLN